jgi:hypothetical protein
MVPGARWAPPTPIAVAAVQMPLGLAVLEAASSECLDRPNDDSTATGGSGLPGRRQTAEDPEAESSQSHRRSSQGVDRGAVTTAVRQSQTDVTSRRGAVVVPGIQRQKYTDPTRCPTLFMSMMAA